MATFKPTCQVLRTPRSHTLTAFSSVTFPLVLVHIPGLTQNNEKTNRKGRKGHEGIRVLERFCSEAIAATSYAFFMSLISIICLG
ncbi:MAG: hypothetical protein V7L25_15675 [Nostoc sp.]|uniref:hypothetical protein n=1 Tax=Nostoc sp. TaxID=1180 RepID=UPI002FEEA7D4